MAQLKQYIEQFFISDASRIDLIGKIIDLDNEIGEYNFDIPLLEETQQSLASAKQPQGRTRSCAYARYQIDYDPAFSVSE